MKADRDIIFSAIAKTDNIPVELKASQLTEVYIRKLAFDSDYIRFLDSQIHLKPRGPEWDARMQNRRQKLAPWIDRELLDATVMTASSIFWLKIDPISERMVLWEEDDRQNECEQCGPENPIPSGTSDAKASGVPDSRGL